MGTDKDRKAASGPELVMVFGLGIMGAPILAQTILNGDHFSPMLSIGMAVCGAVVTLAANGAREDPAGKPTGADEPED